MLSQTISLKDNTPHISKNMFKQICVSLLFGKSVKFNIELVSNYFTYTCCAVKILPPQTKLRLNSSCKFKLNLERLREYDILISETWSLIRNSLNTKRQNFRKFSFVAWVSLKNSNKLIKDNEKMLIKT